MRFGFIGMLVIVTGRVYYVQNSDTFLKQKENQEWRAEQMIKPMRGSIYDANGDQLAFDMPAYDMDMYLPGIKSQGPLVIQKLANKLAPVIGATPNTIVAAINSPDTWLRFYPYMVEVPLAEKDKILRIFSNFNLLNDINPYQTYKRVYPDGTFASDVIGFVDQAGPNDSETGAAGIELQYNSYLTGKPGYKQFMSDSMGDPLPFDNVVTKPVHNGDNVYLTIDASIQHYAENALATIEKRFTPKHAAIIVADPSTGAILAMATLPNYNPNDYNRYPASTLDTNWAISDPFEPGSTFKIVTLTGALATHAINLNQTYMSGVDYVNGVPIHDWNIWGWGRITYRQAMIYSSNVGFIHIGQAEGPLTLAHYIHLFGMDKPTGIDLPGEGTSILFDPYHINAVDFATTTFGQGLAVTPIQQVAEVGAVANGGDLMKPYIVQKVVSPSGKVVYFRKPEIVRRVAPKAIMTEITNVMIQDVSQDPMLMAYVPGYNVAGKTGTANIPSPHGGYYANRYNLSFVGFVPAHHPALEIYVTVSEPHHAIQYGNDVSSPAAKYVLQKSLAYLRIPPHGGAAQSPFAQVATTTYVSVPDLVGQSLNSANRTLKNLRLHPADLDASGVITKQWPQPGTRVGVSSQVILATTSETAVSGSVRIPNLLGMPMIEAVSASSLLGLQLELQGDGYVASQSIAPGKIVPLGTKIAAVFRPIAVKN